jgi:hypothetical protein
LNVWFENQSYPYRLPNNTRRSGTYPGVGVRHVARKRLPPCSLLTRWLRLSHSILQEKEEVSYQDHIVTIKIRVRVEHSNSLDHAITDLIEVIEGSGFVVPGPAPSIDAQEENRPVRPFSDITPQINYWRERGAKERGA